MHLVGFIIRIYHDARSPERQKRKKERKINKQFHYFRALYLMKEPWPRTLALTCLRNRPVAFHLVSPEETMNNPISCAAIISSPFFFTSFFFCDDFPVSH